jgi:hypothetical protein
VGGADDALAVTEAFGAVVDALTVPVGTGAGAALPDRTGSTFGSGTGTTAAHAVTTRQHSAIAVRDSCSQLTM